MSDLCPGMYMYSGRYSGSKVNRKTLVCGDFDVLTVTCSIVDILYSFLETLPKLFDIFQIKFLYEYQPFPFVKVIVFFHFTVHILCSSN